MAATASVYTKLIENLGAGNVDLTDGSTNLKCALYTSGYTPSVNSDEKISDLSSNEASGTGYTAGGEKLTSVTVSRTGDTVTLDADDVSWDNSTIDAAYAVVYDSASDYLIALMDLDGTKSSTAATFKIQWSGSGIVSFTANP